MKEQIHTIPVTEAFSSGDECPFCYLQRQTEQRAINYTLGPSASYMEVEIRAVTNREGFCKDHLKKMFDYGNALGSALILQTWYIDMLEQLEAQLDSYELPEKKSLFRRKKQEEARDGMLPWLEEKLGSCFICNQVEENMERYYATFFTLMKDPEFRCLAENSKGFCLEHFRQLLERAEKYLPNAQREWFHSTVPKLTMENLLRVKEDLDWLVKKYDYRYASADWKNSRDALRRAMQKYQSGHPADKPFTEL